ncbi:MAG: hypothetical protein M9944_11930 [Rhizobiaceae bacterium]|nr:hypothetical protein [Rhizobiaceae bacterium]
MTRLFADVRLYRRARRAAAFSIALALSTAAVSFALPAVSALALSEIQREDLPPPAPATGGTDQQPAPTQEVPLPDPLNPGTGNSGVTPTPEEKLPDDQQVPDDSGDTSIDPNAPIPEVEYDFSKLPEPVRQIRDAIIEAAKTGDPERLRPFIDSGNAKTQLSLGGISGDPIAYLKELSGDDGGQEILAILEEILSTGYVHLDAGKPNELYVWPYFFGVPLDALSAPQRVELFKIITAGDYEDMKTYGAYIFYRAGFTPDGKWSFFIAGD